MFSLTALYKYNLFIIFAALLLTDPLMLCYHQGVSVNQKLLSKLSFSRNMSEMHYFYEKKLEISKRWPMSFLGFAEKSSQNIICFPSLGFFSADILDGMVNFTNFKVFHILQKYV